MSEYFQVDGELVEVEESDIPAFKASQRAKIKPPIDVDKLVDGIVQGIEKSGQVQGDKLASEWREMVTQFVTMLCGSVAEIKLPELPEIEVSLPESARIKKIEVRAVTRNSQSLITGCTLEIKY
jgi:predicted thioredoxin/glutaredoxin